MKLGSIIGLAICCILLIVGAVFCTTGYISAKNSGRYLFTQTNENGSLFVSDIDDGQTSKIRLGVNDAKVTVIGGADDSRVEFINYNPNYYVLSTTSKVINFEEVEDFTSMIKIWENGFSFKGLRYIFDFHDYGENDKNHEIIIYLSEKSSMDAIEIDASNAEILFDNVNLSGNVLLRCNSGKMKFTQTSCGGDFTISGKKLDVNVSDVSAASLSLASDQANVLSEGSSFTKTDVDVTDGRIDFYSIVSLDNANLNVFSSAGGLLVNGSPISGAYSKENEDAEVSFKITTASGDINLNYPSESIDE